MSKFLNFPKDETNTKNGECTARDFNTLGYELENAISSGGIDTNTTENDQLSKSIANRVALGSFYNDVTTDYGHINLSAKTPFKSPTSYYDGMIVTFLPTGNNEENATINVNGLGEKVIRSKITKEGIPAGTIKQNEYVQLIYNGPLNCFVIFSTSSKKQEDGGSGLILGEIKNSVIPLNDERLKLLDGGKIYSDEYEGFTNFIENIKISNICPNLFTNEATWQSTNTSYGFCPKFVFTNETTNYYAFSTLETNAENITIYYVKSLEDNSQVPLYVEINNVIEALRDEEGNQLFGAITTNESGDKILTYNLNDFDRNEESDKAIQNQSVRLPNIVGYNKSITTITDLGKINEDKLPNITGLVLTGEDISKAKPNGAFYVSGTRSGGSMNESEASNDVSFDASRSSTIYKNNINNIELNGYNTFTYIVVGTEKQEDITIVEDVEVYNTIPLGASIFSDHKLTDLNYILSNNEWKDGLMYEDLYSYILSQYNNEASTQETKTFGDSTITYKRTPDDLLIITLSDTTTEGLINSIYLNYRTTFWVLDIANTRFKVPQNTKRTLVESWKSDDGGWYNLYSDGWLEQGKILSVAANTLVTAYYLKPYILKPETVLATGMSSVVSVDVTVSNIDKNSFNIRQFYPNGQADVLWEAVGYSYAPSIYDPNKYLYFKAGNAAVNINRINCDRIFNVLDDKADKDLSNITEIGKKNICNTINPQMNEVITISSGWVCPENSYYWIYTIGSHSGTNQTVYKNDVEFGKINLDVWGAEHRAKANAYIIAGPGDVITGTSGANIKGFLLNFKG